jgi:hypothetical protein
MSPLEDIEQEMRRLVKSAQGQGIPLRLLGGLAIRLHCSSTNQLNLQRSYADIDFVTNKAGGRNLPALFAANGYIPDKTFNTLNGDRRQLYFDETNQRQVDIFIGEFEMCHVLPLANRLELEPLTVPLAELFLTKAQIVELNHKDAVDLVTLLLDHPVGTGDEETINSSFIAGLCAKDWGLYTTVEINLEKLRELIGSGTINLPSQQKDLVLERIQALQSACQAAPKTLGWKARSKVGKRVKWYLEVEEVRR